MKYGVSTNRLVISMFIFYRFLVGEGLLFKGLFINFIKLIKANTFKGNAIYVFPCVFIFFFSVQRTMLKV